MTQPSVGRIDDLTPSIGVRWVIPIVSSCDDYISQPQLDKAIVFFFLGYFFQEWTEVCPSEV
jgi:hypothetical protein